MAQPRHACATNERNRCPRQISFDRVTGLTGISAAWIGSHLAWPCLDCNNSPIKIVGIDLSDCFAQE